MYDKGRIRDAGPHSAHRQAANSQGLWWTERHVLGLDAFCQAASAVLQALHCSPGAAQAGRLHQLQPGPFSTGPLRHKDPRQSRVVVCAAMLQAWCTKGLAWRRVWPHNHSDSTCRTCVTCAAMLQAQRLKGTD